jgi:hypothetical protein
MPRRQLSPACAGRGWRRAGLGRALDFHRFQRLAEAFFFRLVLFDRALPVLRDEPRTGGFRSPARVLPGGSMMNLAGGSGAVSRMTSTVDGPVWKRNEVFISFIE